MIRAVTREPFDRSVLQQAFEARSRAAGGGGAQGCLHAKQLVELVNTRLRLCKKRRARRPALFHARRDERPLRTHTSALTSTPLGLRRVGTRCVAPWVSRCYY